MEQALVFASIIVSAAITDQIVSLHRLLRSSVPVKWHWAQPWFAFLVLLLNVMVWWSVVGRKDDALTIGEFLPVLVQLLLLALLTISTLPDKVEPEGVDLASYYQANRRYQWLLLALSLGWSMAADAIAAWHGEGSIEDVLARRGEDLIPLAIMVGLAFVRRWWIIGLGLALLSLGPINWLSRSIS